VFFKSANEDPLSKDRNASQRLMVWIYGVWCLI